MYELVLQRTEPVCVIEGKARSSGEERPRPSFNAILQRTELVCRVNGGARRLGVGGRSSSHHATLQRKDTVEWLKFALVKWGFLLGVEEWDWVDFDVLYFRGKFI